jgi:hypothetical protein
MSTIKARKPTGTVPWPLVLIEGPEKSGKSYAAAEFTASERIGQAYWIDIAEGAADEYAAIPGANYLVIEHDGSWRAIMEQLQAVHDEAARAAKAGEPPVVVIIDSGTAEWELLKDWTSYRGRQTKNAKRILAADPDAEIKPGRNLWNDANDRHRAFMHLLMTFPGIAIVTARGKTIAATGDDGQPIPNSQEHKVEGHKGLAYDATAWVRLSRDEHPKVVGVRSIHAGIRPGVDRAKVAPQFTIEWLIFDVMKCDPATAHVRDHVMTDEKEPTPEPAEEHSRPPVEPAEPDYQAIEEWAAGSTDVAALKAAWKRMNGVKTERAGEACALIAARAKALQTPTEPEQQTIEEAGAA